MIRNDLIPSILAAACAMALLAGCVSEPVDPAPREVPTGLNPTAERLHEICGSILLFHGAYHRMPESLEELRRATGMTPDAIIDPVTRRPFAYVPEGFATSPAGRRAVLLAAPGPGAETCWAVTVLQANRSLSAKVVALPAEAFAELAGKQTPAAPDGG